MPLYFELYEKYRDAILKEVYPHGSRLPSKRLVAEENGVSVITVEHAYALLADEGYVEARERSGYFVIFRKTDGFAVPANRSGLLYGQAEPRHPSGAQTASVSDGSDGQPNIPFTVLARTMRRVISEYGEGLLQRSPNQGLDVLRLEISRYLFRSREISISPERIIIGAGTEYLYHLLIGLLGTQRIYGIESPSYRMIENVYRNAGIQYRLLPLGKDGILSSALDETDAGILHVTPYRSFPSGVSASASKRHEYIRWAAEHNRYLIEDDYESEFSVLRKPEDTLFSLSQNDNVIYLNTFSQSISPSFRVGYMLLPEHLLPLFREKLGFYSCTVSTAIQYVLAELIGQGDFERHINHIRRIKRKQEACGRRKEETV